MYSEKQAIALARTRARRTGDEQYLFFEGDGYDFGNDFEADTHFGGQTERAVIYPDGSVYWS